MTTALSLWLPKIRSSYWWQMTSLNRKKTSDCSQQPPQNIKNARSVSTVSIHSNRAPPSLVYRGPFSQLLLCPHSDLSRMAENICDPLSTSSHKTTLGVPVGTPAPSQGKHRNSLKSVKGRGDGHFLGVQLKKVDFQEGAGSLSFEMGANRKHLRLTVKWALRS